MIITLVAIIATGIVWWKADSTTKETHGAQPDSEYIQIIQSHGICGENLVYLSHATLARCAKELGNGKQSDGYSLHQDLIQSVGRHGIEGKKLAMLSVGTLEMMVNNLDNARWY
ncbi:MAG: hypothetical protein ABIF10_05335 [Candidatus Woesearchaeota archaeon]